jgi:hypothetical protein
MRNRSNVTSAITTKSNDLSSKETLRLKENYAKLRKANIEQSKQILKLADALQKAEMNH